MRKKEIEKIPFGDRKVRIHKDTLLIDVVSEGKNARICIRKTEFANFVEGKGWNQKLLGGGYYGYGSGFIASGLDSIKENENAVAMEFIEKMLIKSCSYWTRTQSLQRKIEVAQDYINEQKRQVKEKNRRKRIDDHLKAIKGPSDKLKKWAVNQMPSYLFYRTESKKSSGRCPACQETVEFDRKTAKIRHNQRGKCPACGKEIVFKAAGRQKRIEEKMKTVRFSKTKYGLAAIESVTVKRSCEGGEECSDTKDLYIKFLQEGFELYDVYQGEGTPYWSDSEKCGMGSYPHGNALIYRGGLKQSIKGTPFEHSGIDVVASWEFKKEPWIDILSLYKANPDTEKIIKAGMKKLVRTMYPWERFLNKGEKLHEILGVTRKNMRIARDNDFSKKEIQILRGDPDGKLSLDEIQGMVKAGMYLEALKKYTTIKKICTYLKKGHDPGEWADYLRMAKQLGYDMHSKAVLFPKGLTELHNKVTKEMRVMKSAEKEKKYQKRKAELKKYLYKTSKYTIVIPESLEAIITEGQELHHCVGAYVEAVAEGRTNILFIREIGKEDNPYYTMEIRDERIVQYRGAYNNRHANPVPKSMKQFVKMFEQNMIRKQRKAA